MGEDVEVVLEIQMTPGTADWLVGVWCWILDCHWELAQ